MASTSTVVARLGKALLGIALDQAVMGLFRRAMAGVGVLAQIGLAVEGLGVVPPPCRDLVFIHPGSSPSSSQQR